MARKISRREFLKLGAGSAGAAVIATYLPTLRVIAQGPQGTPQAMDATLVVMYPDGEFPKDYREAVKSQFGVTIEFLQEDLNRLSAMWAAGTPPDIWRANAIQIGPHVVRKQVLDLSGYVDASKVVKWDDLQPSYKQHMFDGVKRGAGKLYGLPKDWGTDFLVFCYTDAFKEAGIPVPSDEKPMSYKEFFDLGDKLTKKEGNRTARWGVTSHYWETGPGPQFYLDVLPQIEGAAPLFAEDFSKVNLAKNAGVVEVFKTWFDAAKKHSTPSAVDPMPSWFGQVFTQGTLGMAQAGYWYGASAESDVTKGKVVVLPAPYWSSMQKRRNSSVWATATVGSSKTKSPDATWKVIEYYSGGQPAIDRAKQGWGVPLLKSLFKLLPQGTAYDKQRYKVLAAELPFAENALAYNPYISDLLEAANIIQSALESNAAPEKALQQIEDATNAAIQDAKDRLS